MAKKDINMTEGHILGKMIAYTLPLLLSGILQILYNAVDVAVVGRYAENSQLALAAVGSTGSLTNLIVGLFMGLSVGSCVVISQCLGAKDDKSTSEVHGQRGPAFQASAGDRDRSAPPGVYPQPLLGGLPHNGLPSDLVCRV